MICAFGSSWALLPLPHAADASEPTANRSESSLERRSLSSDNKTMSISSPPNCTPRLAVSSVIAAGADQPTSLRHEMNPRPNPMPNPAAPFLNPGITAMQSALAIRPEKIPCSDSVSFANTAVALFSRAAVSSEALAEIAPTIVKRRDAWKFLILVFFPAGHFAACLVPEEPGSDRFVGAQTPWRSAGSLFENE